MDIEKDLAFKKIFTRKYKIENTKVGGFCFAAIMNKKRFIAAVSPFLFKLHKPGISLSKQTNGIYEIDIITGQTVNHVPFSSYITPTFSPGDWFYDQINEKLYWSSYYCLNSYDIKKKHISGYWFSSDESLLKNDQYIKTAEENIRTFISYHKLPENFVRMLDIFRNRCITLFNDELYFVGGFGRFSNGKINMKGLSSMQNIENEVNRIVLYPPLDTETKHGYGLQAFSRGVIFFDNNNRLWAVGASGRGFSKDFKVRAGLYIQDEYTRKFKRVGSLPFSSDIAIVKCPIFSWINHFLIADSWGRLYLLNCDKKELKELSMIKLPRHSFGHKVTKFMRNKIYYL